MLLKSACYYIIEKNYIKSSDIPKELQIMKLPPNKIIEFIQKINGQTIENIFDSFYEYFNESSVNDINNYKVKEFVFNDNL